MMYLHSAIEGVPLALSLIYTIMSRAEDIKSKLDITLYKNISHYQGCYDLLQNV
jgi:hypothetical protein